MDAEFSMSVVKEEDGYHVALVFEQPLKSIAAARKFAEELADELAEGLGWEFEDVQ